MTLPISYGSCSQEDFLDAGESIVRDFDEANSGVIIDKINATFFGGRNFSPKSLAILTSIDIPAAYIPESHLSQRRFNLSIGVAQSYSFLIGYIEAIPVIGSAVAAINAFGQLYLMYSARAELVRAIGQLRIVERTSGNQRVSLIRTHEVFQSATDLTVHYNSLISSLLSIVPFLKPALRTAQCLAYYCCPRALTQRV